MKVGIIGLGSFGGFIAHLVPSGAEVIGFDTHITTAPKGVKLAALKEVAKSDVVFLAIPLASYEGTLRAIKGSLKKDALIVDICSVKKAPSELLKKQLPGHRNILVTHPLFGPQSAQHSTKGHTLVVTKAQGKRAQEMLRYCQDDLGLIIQKMNADEHDKQMATIHALTFFVARTLKESGVRDEVLSTPSYKALLDLAKLDGAHSEELFLTIERGNPHAKQAYVRYLKEAEKLAMKLDDVNAYQHYSPSKNTSKGVNNWSLSISTLPEAFKKRVSGWRI